MISEDPLGESPASVSRVSAGLPSAPVHLQTITSGPNPLRASSFGRFGGTPLELLRARVATNNYGAARAGSQAFSCGGFVLSGGHLPRASNALESIAKRTRTISIVCDYPGRRCVLPNRKLSRCLVAFKLTVSVCGRLPAVGAPVQTIVDA
jgi:hypothetical protein